jgi:uncharacterized protein
MPVFTHRQGGALPSRCVALALIALLASTALAQQPVPPLTGRIVDRTGVLADADRQRIETRLADLEQRKGSQVAVLLVPSARPEAIEQFSMRVVEAWQLGRRGVDDGVLLLVALEDREVRLEVGYGLEGAIPDAYGRRIIDEAILPAFRDGDFVGGIEAGVTRVIGLIDGEPLPEPPQRPRPTADFEAAVPAVTFFAFIAGGFLVRLLGQLPGAVATGLLAGGLGWLITAALGVAFVLAIVGFMIGLMAGTPPGRWSSGGGFSGGRGGFGGGRGGGGFSGGGGSFGGGGSTGRW